MRMSLGAFGLVSLVLILNLMDRKTDRQMRYSSGCLWACDNLCFSLSWDCRNVPPLDCVWVKLFSSCCTVVSVFCLFLVEVKCKLSFECCLGSLDFAKLWDVLNLRFSHESCSDSKGVSESLKKKPRVFILVVLLSPFILGILWWSLTTCKLFSLGKMGMILLTYSVNLLWKCREILQTYEKILQSVGHYKNSCP